MVTQSSKQSQNQITQKNKKSVSDFHNSCNVKKEKDLRIKKS